MHFRSPIATLATCATLAVMSLLSATGHASAQRRPDVPMGFYTTTGLPTLDVEAGSVTSTTVLAEAPRIALSGLVTRAVIQQAKRAWIVGVRGTPLSFGNNDQCAPDFRTGECQSARFTERVSVIAGGAFDIRSTILRVMVGPALYSVQRSGTRIGTQVRIDFASPRLNGPTPTLFVTRSMLGSQGGRGVGLTTLGAGLRWVKK